MGIIKLTLKFAVVVLIIWGLALVLDGEVTFSGESANSFMNFVTALPPQLQNALAGIAFIVGFIVLMKAT